MTVNDAFKTHALRFIHKRATKKLAKTIPVLGAVFAAGLVWRNVREKGLARGVIDTALDLTPVVGPVKAVTEIFVGDLIQPAPGDNLEPLPPPLLATATE